MAIGFLALGVAGLCGVLMLCSSPADKDDPVTEVDYRRIYRAVSPEELSPV